MEDTNTIKIFTNYGKSVKYLLLITVFFAALNVAYSAYLFADGNMGVNTILNLIIAIMFVFGIWSQSKVERLNFVSFKNDRFILQKATAFNQSKNEILYADILSIALQEKKIVVGLKNNSKFEIDMKNYSYKTTTQIKSEFATLEKKLSAKN